MQKNVMMQKNVFFYTFFKFLNKNAF